MNFDWEQVKHEQTSAEEDSEENVETLGMSAGTCTGGSLVINEITKM
ncbi:hypothetical protein [Psychrobacillus soli]|nr:hypothetical protein [Psychrobacillus soli]